MRRSTRLLLDAVAAPLPDVCAIPLLPVECGRVTLLDWDDVETVGGADLWLMHIGVERTPYVSVSLRGARIGTLHRLLLKVGDGVWVDHRNGDTLDNSRKNIRACSPSQNAMNRRKPRAGRYGPVTGSIYKGVGLLAKALHPTWYAKISRRHIGSYATEIEAAHAYDDAARREFGEFAALNFASPGERSALGAAPLVVALSNGLGLRDVA